MSFFQDYSTFINILLAIALAIFLFKKLNAHNKPACMPNGGRPNIEMLPLATCNKFSKR